MYCFFHPGPFAFRYHDNRFAALPRDLHWCTVGDNTVHQRF